MRRIAGLLGRVTSKAVEKLLVDHRIYLGEMTAVLWARVPDHGGPLAVWREASNDRHYYPAPV